MSLAWWQSREVVAAAAASARNGLYSDQEQHGLHQQRGSPPLCDDGTAYAAHLGSH